MGTALAVLSIALAASTGLLYGLKWARIAIPELLAKRRIHRAAAQRRAELRQHHA
jgi:hypothetical protein